MGSADLTTKTVSGVIWKLAERLSAQIVSLIVSIILARLLSPDHYGVISLVMIVITFLNVFVSNGFGTALIQKKDADDLDFSTILFSSLVLSFILYAILFFMAEPIAIYYDDEIITLVLRVMGLRLPIAAINSVQQAYVAKKMIFRKFFFATLIGTVISGAVGIVMAYYGYGVWSLVAQYLTNVLIDTVILGIVIRWRPKFVFSFKRLKRLFSFGWKLLVSGLIDVTYNEIRSLIIGKKYSKVDLAYYDKGKQFPKLISVNINSSIGIVLFSTMSRFQDDRLKLKEITRSSIKICSYFILPCMVGLACVATPFVKIVLTDKWLPIVPYLQIMCFVYAFYPLHTANLQAINAAGRSDLYLKIEIVKKSIGFAILMVTMWFGVFWIALGMALQTITSALVNAFPNRKLLNYSYGEQLIDLLPNIIISLFMGVGVYSLSFINMNVYILLITQIFAGIGIYILLSVITKNYSFNFVCGYMLKKYKNSRSKKDYRTEFLDDFVKNNSYYDINQLSLDSYIILYDEEAKGVCIGKCVNGIFYLYYCRFKNTRGLTAILNQMFINIINEYDVESIVFSCDKKSSKLLIRNGFVEKYYIGNKVNI